MPGRKDLVDQVADESADLYDVSRWEPRSRLDRLSVYLYRALTIGLQGLVVLLAIVIMLSLFVSPAVLIAEDPLVSAFFLLSVLPAGLLAAYITYADISAREPLGLLVGTFMLAILFATFAAVVNGTASSLLVTTSLVGGLIYYYGIVGPVEETVKLVAVRVLPYHRSFDSVIDGAVYGAVAGLGFATIENALYIARYVTEFEPQIGLIPAATGIAAVRALVGPGHVIYSSIAGYYLGLAKYNPDHAGPLVVKGLLVAAFAHGTYNVTVQGAPDIIASLTPLGTGTAFVLYVVGFNGLVGYYLYRKIATYRRTFLSAVQGSADHSPEMTEFDPPNR